MLALAIALQLSLSHASLAQRLHFTSDEPKPNTGEVASALASKAREQFDALREQGAATAIAQAKQAYLAAAGILLETGEGKGVGGTFQVAAGVALMRDRDSVFVLLDAKRLDDGAARLLASDLSQMVQAPPATSAELDRALRDAFANLLQSSRSQVEEDASLWPWPEVADAQSLAWPDVARLGPDAAPLDALHKRCELADQWLAFRPGARAMTRLVMEASWPLGREKQISAGVYRRWMSELSRGADEVVSEPTGASGLLRLQRLATLGNTFALLDALAPDPGAKQLEKALAAAVETMPDDPVDSGWSKLEQWIALAAARTALVDDKQVVRQLRPALRSIGDLSKVTQLEMFLALTRVVNNPDAAGDPGVMAAVNLYSENLELLRVLHRASDALEDPSASPNDPVARDNAKPFTDGLLKLSKEVADPKQRDRSLGALRNLATDVADLLELPGERSLREMDPQLVAAIGGKAQDLLDAIERERISWRRGVGAVMKPGNSSGGEANAARLRAIGTVLALAMDTAACKAITSDSSDPLQQWGGWWLSDDALQSLTSDAAAAIPALIMQIEAGQASPASIESLAREHAVVALAARLLNILEAAAPQAIPQDSLPRIRAIATGTPDRNSVALAEWRDRLAVVCRYSEEGAAGHDDAKQFASTKAAECLEALNRRAPNQSESGAREIVAP